MWIKKNGELQSVFIARKVAHRVSIHPDVLGKVGVLCDFKLIELLYAIAIIIRPFIDALPIGNLYILESALCLLPIAELIERLKAQTARK